MLNNFHATSLSHFSYIYLPAEKFYPPKNFLILVKMRKWQLKIWILRGKWQYPLQTRWGSGIVVQEAHQGHFSFWDFEYFLLFFECFKVDLRISPLLLKNIQYCQIGNANLMGIILHCNPCSHSECMDFTESHILWMGYCHPLIYNLHLKPYYGYYLLSFHSEKKKLRKLLILKIKK